MLDVFQANNVGVGLVSLQHTSSHEGLWEYILAETLAQLNCWWAVSLKQDEEFSLNKIDFIAGVAARKS
jgi:hypothetical protein